MKFSKRSQSVLEYVLIIGVVATAVVAMSLYFNRAIQARIYQIQEEYSPPSRSYNQ